jgi:hypothetical protein
MSILFDRLNAPMPRSVGDMGAIDPGTQELSVDKATVRLDLLPRFRHLSRLHLREVPPVHLPVLSGLDRLTDLRIFGTRAEVLPPLPAGLRTLELRWAPRLEALGPVAALDWLEVLSIGDLKRVRDLPPLGRLRSLWGLAITAGMWADQPVESLDFLSDLTRLQELAIGPIRLASGDLRPVGRLRGLRRLALSNTWPVRELVRLKVALPDTESPVFQPVQTFRTATATDDDSPDGFAWREEVMLNGRPVRHLRADEPGAAAQIARRTALFAAWEAHYRSVPDPLADTRETL